MADSETIAGNELETTVKAFAFFTLTKLNVVRCKRRCTLDPDVRHKS